MDGIDGQYASSHNHNNNDHTVPGTYGLEWCRLKKLPQCRQQTFLSYTGSPAPSPVHACNEHPFIHIHIHVEG